MTNGKQNGTDTSEAFKAKPKRRMGRGKLVFVRPRPDNPRSAELDPEATRSTDQTLTEISLKSANSDRNAAVIREREKIADRCEHIKSGLPAKQQAVLTKVLDVVEPADSVREIGRKACLHATQIRRAFDAAREADKRRIFAKRASRQRRAFKPYNPRCVPMETVMMPHQGPILYTIQVPDRLIGNLPPVHKMASPKTPMAPVAEVPAPVGAEPAPDCGGLQAESGTPSGSGEPATQKFELKQLFSLFLQRVSRRFRKFFGLSTPYVGTNPPD